MNVNSDTNMPEGEGDKNLCSNNKATSMFFDNAPLAAPEDDSDDLAEYAQVKEVYGTDGVLLNEQNMYTFPHDASTPNKSSTTTATNNNKLRHRRDNNKSLQSNIFDIFSSSISFFKIPHR